MSAGDALFRIHPVCEAFEDGQRAGSSPTIEEYLDGFDGHDRRVLFTHLLELEVDYRSRRGEVPTAVEYLRRFPDFADVVAGLSGLGAGPLAAGGRDTVGDYTLLREIGRGGMGVVYEAAQRSLGRRVALKILPREVSAHPEASARFLREARAAARLHHTNIVPVYEVGRTGDVLFYSMQLIEGIPVDRLSRDLAVGNAAPASEPARCRREDRPAWYRLIARIGARIADALTHAHERGILHRDVKPANVILDHSGTPWLTDFGLARTEDAELTVPGDLVGTLRYLAPERLRGMVDVRVDVYALGATLWELAALRPLFPARDRAELLRHVAEVEPEPLPSIDPDIPRDLDTIIRTALAKEPAERYPTAAALAADLEAFLADLPIRARRTSPVDQARRWVRKNRRLAAALAAVVVLLLAGITAAVLAANEFSRQAEQSRRVAADERQQRYYAEMGYAGGLLRADVGVSRIREIVDGWVPPPRGGEDPRGWEWDFLDAYTYPADLVLDAGSSLCMAAWTEDGKGLFGSSFGRVCRWDATSGRLDFEIPAGGSPVRQRVLPGQGDRIAVGGNDRKLRIYDREGQAVAVFEDAPIPRITRFSPDGRLVAAAGDYVLDVWRIEDRQKLVHLADIGADFQWSPEGHKLFVQSRDALKLRVIATDTWELMKEIPCRVHFLSAHPAGGIVAVSCEREGDGLPCVRFVDVERGEVVRELLGMSQRIDSIGYDATGSRIAAGGCDGSIRIWTGDEPAPKVLRGHAHNVQSLAWHGDRLASAGGDGILRVWDVDRPSAVRESDLRLTTGELERTRCRGSQGLPPLRWLEGGATIAASPVWGDYRQFRVRTGESLKSPARILSSDDGVWTACVERSRRLVFRHRDRGTPLEFADTRFEHFLFFGPPTHDWALAMAGDSGIWLFDLREPGAARRIFSAAGWWALAAPRPDGRAVAVAGRDRVEILSAPGGEPLQVFDGRGLEIYEVAWSADGTQLAVAGQERGIRIWNPATGAVRLLAGHASRTWSVAFHPGGARLASGGRDRTVRIWDLGSGRETLVLHHDEEVGAVSWSPDGKILASLSEDGILKLWDASGPEAGVVPPPGPSGPH